MSRVDWSWIQPEPYELFIGGEFTRGSAGRTFDIVNPASNQVIARAWEAAVEDVDRAVASARRAFDEGPWPHLTTRERGEYLLRVADLIRANQDRLAFLEAADVGKTLARTLDYALPQAIDAFIYHAARARDLAGEVRPVPQAGFFNYRVWEPMGVVAEILPWNGPLMMACQKVSAILAAGNTVVVKPAPDGSLSNLALAGLFAQAELPPGVVNVVAGPPPALGQRLAEHPGVDMVSLTGSTQTGQAVMRAAANTVKKVALELSGKNPNVIFADADLEEAARWALYGAFADQGQICVAGSRLLVQHSVHDEFLALFIERVRQLKLGDTMADDTDVGPVITPAHERKVLDYIAQGQREGARLVLGGAKVVEPPLDRGNYLEPAVFAGVAPGMCIGREEIFGPVATLTAFESEAEAIRLANSGPFGLAAGVWTRDLDRALRMANSLDVGQLYVNSYYSPAMLDSPAEGHKQSGLGGAGLTKYMQEKTVFIRLKP
jgi:acyl-CoA reductase-like NAD-dependent aldehyde dehydrogenase